MTERRFSEDDLDWLRMIEHLKMSGMTIAAILEKCQIHSVH